jgi:hypothetical protein
MGSNMVAVSLGAGEMAELACLRRKQHFPILKMIFRRHSYVDLHAITAAERELMAQIAAQLTTPIPRNLNLGSPPQCRRAEGGVDRHFGAARHGDIMDP